MQLPKDLMIRLSYVNTQLRDFYSNLDDFCKAAGVDKETLCQDFKQIDYEYNEQSRQFV
ncbi:MAG: DUF4250 domain-containing protein [bacterium]|nr:DUF4250 domain-containing protein [bacterium]